MEEFVVVIQKVWRGYRIRKKMKQVLNEYLTMAMEELDGPTHFDQQNYDHIIHCFTLSRKSKISIQTTKLEQDDFYIEEDEEEPFIVDVIHFV